MSRCIILAALALSACQLHPSPTPSPISTGGKNLISFTQADLANAVAQATGANPPDTIGAMCYVYLQAQLSLLSASTNGTGPIGIASTFEAGRLTLGSLSGVLSNQQQNAFDQACGPLIMSATFQGLTLAQQISEIAALLGK